MNFTSLYTQRVQKKSSKVPCFSWTYSAQQFDLSVLVRDASSKAEWLSRKVCTSFNKARASPQNWILGGSGKMSTSNSESSNACGISCSVRPSINVWSQDSTSNSAQVESSLSPVI